MLPQRSERFSGGKNICRVTLDRHFRPHFGDAAVGPDGRIAKVWSKVSVDGHAADVLAAAKAL